MAKRSSANETKIMAEIIEIKTQHTDEIETEAEPQSEIRQPKKLNLKYVVDDTLDNRIPWPILILIAMFILLIAAGVWTAYKRQQPKLIAHTIKEDDSLRSLATFYYGNPRLWKKIFLQNREQLMITRELIAGQKIYIPITREQKQKLLERLKRQNLVLRARN